LIAITTSERKIEVHYITKIRPQSSSPSQKREQRLILNKLAETTKKLSKNWLPIQRRQPRSLSTDSFSTSHADKQSP